VFKLLKDEKVMEECSANYICNKKLIGGTLQITNFRILFKPHSFDWEMDRVKIEKRQIKEVKKINFFGFIPNGVSIEVSPEKNYKFMVKKRSRVIKFLEKVDCRIKSENN